MQQKIEEELQEEELLEDLLHNQQINGLAAGKMSQNSSNETDSKMAKTGKQAASVNNKKQGASQAGFLWTEKSEDCVSKIDRLRKPNWETGYETSCSTSGHSSSMVYSREFRWLWITVRHFGRFRIIRQIICHKFHKRTVWWISLHFSKFRNFSRIKSRPGLSVQNP